MARLYLDENQSPYVQHILEQAGHDVIHAYDMGNWSTLDPQHLLVAAQEERILVTFNRRDFRELHRFWTALNTWEFLDRRHAGILTSWGNIADDPWAYLVTAFLEQGRNLDNKMWEWRRQQQRWFLYGW